MNYAIAVVPELFDLRNPYYKNLCGTLAYPMSYKSTVFKRSVKVGRKRG